MAEGPFYPQIFPACWRAGAALFRIIIVNTVHCASSNNEIYYIIGSKMPDGDPLSSYSTCNNEIITGSRGVARILEKGGQR